MADFEKIKTLITSPHSGKPLELHGKGIYGTEIHFLEIKFYSVGFYANPELSSHLAQWKGKPIDTLLDEESDFYNHLCSAPVEKLVKFVIFKEIKGSQFVLPLQNRVRDSLVAEDKYEEEEEEALEKLEEFFQKHSKVSWFSKDTAIYFHWTSPKSLNVTVVDPSVDADETALAGKVDCCVTNENVVQAILDWVVGARSFSPSLQQSIASTIQGS